jgi:hypothetical protein
MRPKVIEWDGVHLPEGLRALPAGQYAIEPLGEPLSDDEEAGISEGLNELDAGYGVPLTDVVQEIRLSVKKR